MIYNHKLPCLECKVHGLFKLVYKSQNLVPIGFDRRTLLHVVLNLIEHFCNQLNSGIETRRTGVVLEIRYHLLNFVHEHTEVSYAFFYVIESCCINRPHKHAFDDLFRSLKVICLD